jgi:hypothetical protein
MSRTPEGRESKIGFFASVRFLIPKLPSVPFPHIQLFLNYDYPKEK